MIMSKQTEPNIIKTFLLATLDDLLKQSKITLDEWLKLSEMTKSSDINTTNLVYEIIKTK